MLFFANKDVPGVIATISAKLAQNSINIADFRLGRDKNGTALAVVLVDSEVPKKFLKELEALDVCIWVAYAEI